MRKKAKSDINSAGGPIFFGNVDNRGVIKGRSDIHEKGFSSKDAALLFADLFHSIDKHPGLSIEDKSDLKTEIQELRSELDKKGKANESFLLRRLRNIKRMAPDILEVTLAVITNQALGFGLIAKKIAEKIKSTAI